MREAFFHEARRGLSRPPPHGRTRCSRRLERRLESSRSARKSRSLQARAVDPPISFYHRHDRRQLNLRPHGEDLNARSDWARASSIRMRNPDNFRVENDPEFIGGGS